MDTARLEYVQTLTGTTVQVVKKLLGLECCTVSHRCEIRMSEEFELDGRQIVLIDTPDIDMSNHGLKLIAAFLAKSYVKT